MIYSVYKARFQHGELWPRGVLRPQGDDWETWIHRHYRNYIYIYMKLYMLNMIMIDNYNIYIFSCNHVHHYDYCHHVFYISGVHCARTFVQEADFATNFAASSNGPWRPGRVAVWRLLWCRGWTKHDESIGHLNVGYEIFNDQIIFFWNLNMAVFDRNVFETNPFDPNWLCRWCSPAYSKLWPL